MALANGSVGIIYRQFTITMSVSILFSAFLALTLTPALCATMLKPIDKNHVKKGVFAWFDRSFEKLNNRYEHGLFKVIKHKRTAMLFFIGIVVALLFVLNKYLLHLCQKKIRVGL
nr:Multidrug resistance protein MexB [Acinetobacter gerneri]